MSRQKVDKSWPFPHKEKRNDSELVYIYTFYTEAFEKPRQRVDYDHFVLFRKKSWLGRWRVVDQGRLDTLGF